MVTTDKVTVTEFAPHIGKTTTDYKENDMEIKATESGFNQTVQKDQATLIAELISRVTSLEESMEYVLEQITYNINERICDGCIYVEGSQWCEKCNGEPKHWAKGE